MKYVWEQVGADGRAHTYIIEAEKLDSSLEVCNYENKRKRIANRRAKRNIGEDVERISTDELSKYICEAKDN